MLAAIYARKSSDQNVSDEAAIARLVDAAPPKIAAGRVVAFLLMAAALTGCQTAPVYLQHPVTKEIAKCGPYDARVAHYGSSVERERGCIQDFQRQGFERMAKPPE